MTQLPTSSRLKPLLELTPPRIRGCAASPYEAAQDMAFEPWMRGPDFAEALFDHFLSLSSIFFFPTLKSPSRPGRLRSP